MLRSKCNEQGSCVAFHGCIILRNTVTFKAQKLTSHAWCLLCCVRGCCLCKWSIEKGWIGNVNDK